jgi:hypothetical protein
LKDYSAHIAQDLPATPAQVESFLNGKFRKYVEPIPGFFLSRVYKKSEVEKVAGELKPTANDGEYRDTKFGFLWTEFEIAMLYYDFMLHGERRLP